MQNTLAPETIAEHLLNHLNENATGPAWHLIDPPRVKYMPWSTLYFLQVTTEQETKHLVVKIVRFPNQSTPEVSWTSSELTERGKREFDSMRKVYSHFLAQSSLHLKALRPEAYLQEINAIVMEFVSGVPLYNNYLTARKLLTLSGQEDAQQALRRTGQWLALFHAMPAESVPFERAFGPPDALQALTEHVNQLHKYGIFPEDWPGWHTVLDALQNVRAGQRVWVHGDFHLRNIFVMPDESILSLDIALERFDSPCFDIGKLIADIKTRRTRILTLGLLPPGVVIDKMIESFLAAYTSGTNIDRATLALYEGKFIFQK